MDVSDASHVSVAMDPNLFPILVMPNFEKPISNILQIPVKQSNSIFSSRVQSRKNRIAGIPEFLSPESEDTTERSLHTWKQQGTLATEGAIVPIRSLGLDWPLTALLGFNGFLRDFLCCPTSSACPFLSIFSAAFLTIRTYANAKSTIR